jgi:hypothetical protein
MDFIAIGDPDPSDSTNVIDVWWFWREKADEISQRKLGTHIRNPISTITDFNNDEIIDLVSAEVTKPNYIDTVIIRSFTNLNLVETAHCFYTDDPANPDNCAFLAKEGVDLVNWIDGQWIFKISRSAVDINGDKYKDLAILKISSGSNVPVPVAVLEGNGDGTFKEPDSTDLISHNPNGSGQGPANAILFGDFNNDGTGDLLTGMDDDGDAGSLWFYQGNTTSGTCEDTNGDPAEDTNGDPILTETDCNAANETWVPGSFTVGASSVKALDINTSCNSNCSDEFGSTSSVFNFDFDFDGNEDILVGYRTTVGNTTSKPSETKLWFGNGDGTFTDGGIVKDYLTDPFSVNFAVPRRVCTRFPIQ